MSGTRECRYCGKQIRMLPVAQRGGKLWPFEPGYVPYDDSPDAGEQWAYRRDRGGVIDLSTTTDQPAQCLIRHACREYAQEHVAKMTADAEKWGRMRGAAVRAERDDATYQVALRVERPSPRSVGGGFARIQILAMACRGELRAPARLFKGAAFDVPLELAHRAHDITRVTWVFVYNGLIYKPVPHGVLQLTPAGETQLRDDYGQGLMPAYERPDWLAYEPLADEVVDWDKLHAERPAEPDEPRYSLDVAARAIPEIARWRRSKHQGKQQSNGDQE
jgi:hypothetical protein